MRAVDAHGEEEHESKRREHDDPAQRASVDGRAETGQAHAAQPGDGLRRVVGYRQHIRAKGSHARDGESQHHVVVDAQHICAKALVDLGCAGPGYA